MFCDPPNDVSFSSDAKFVPRSIDFKPSISRFDSLDKVVRLGIRLHELFSQLYVPSQVYIYIRARILFCEGAKRRLINRTTESK